MSILKAQPDKPKQRMVRTDDEWEERLAELADKFGLSKSEVIRQSVDHVHEVEFPKRGKK